MNDLGGGGPIHEIKYDGYRMTRIDYMVEYAEWISERTQEGLFRERMVKVAAALAVAAIQAADRKFIRCTYFVSMSHRRVSRLRDLHGKPLYGIME
jgi:hypothetical protein